MSLSKRTWGMLGVAMIGLLGAATLAIAQAPPQDVIGKLDNNQGILVDKQSYDVIKGNAKTDNPLATLEKMGAREVSAGAIVFRYGDKLYIVDGTPPAKCFTSGHERLPEQLERQLQDSARPRQRPRSCCELSQAWSRCAWRGVRQQRGVCSCVC